MRPGPLGVTGYSISNDDDGANIFSSGIGGVNTFENYQASLDTQNQPRGGGETGLFNQHAATTYDVHGAGNFLQHNQALPSLQNQPHCGELAGYPDQRATATHDTYGVAPIGGSTQHSQASLSAPKENARKRPRID
jgi:hypothetical protein